jgi:hypothetical protein
MVEETGYGLRFAEKHTNKTISTAIVSVLRAYLRCEDVPPMLIVIVSESTEGFDGEYALSQTSC